MILEPMDGRIAVALEGDQIDLDDACFFFSDGEVQVRKLTIPPNEKVVLLAEILNGLTDFAVICRIGDRLLGLINGLLFAEDATRIPIKAQGIYHRQGANGNWGVSIALAAGHARGRSRMRIDNRQPGELTQQASTLTVVLQNETAIEVLTYLKDLPDWIDLYKAFEAIKGGVFGTTKELRTKPNWWPSNSKIREFTGDAQFVRHSSIAWRKDRDRDSAMPLSEAREFIRDLCSKWLGSL